MTALSIILPQRKSIISNQRPREQGFCVTSTGTCGFWKDLENHKEITKAKECVEPRLCIATHILSKANSCGPFPMHKCCTHWCDWPCWLQADLAEQDRIKRLRMRMWVDWLEVWGMRIVINVLVFVLLCGSLALIGFTTSKMIDVSID